MYDIYIIIANIDCAMALSSSEMNLGYIRDIHFLAFWIHPDGYIFFHRGFASMLQEYKYYKPDWHSSVWFCQVEVFLWHSGGWGFPWNVCGLEESVLHLLLPMLHCSVRKGLYLEVEWLCPWNCHHSQLSPGRIYRLVHLPSPGYYITSETLGLNFFFVRLIVLIIWIKRILYGSINNELEIFFYHV